MDTSGDTAPRLAPSRKRTHQSSPGCRNAPTNSTRRPGRRTAGGHQTDPAPRGAADQGIPARLGAAEGEGQDAQSFAATHPSKFGCAKTPSNVGADAIGAQSTTGAIPNATGTEERLQPAKHAPPELNRLTGEICPECRIAARDDVQGACGTCRHYVRSRPQKDRMAAHAFRANAGQPDLEEWQLFNAALVELRGGEIAS